MGLQWCTHTCGKTITITGAGEDAAIRENDERDRELIFTNYALFSKCVSKINNRQVDNAKDLAIVMPMYNLIEYSKKIAKTLGSLWP